MAIIYKIDIVKALKDAGWSSYRIRKEKIIGEQQMTQIRKGEIVSIACLDKICKLLNCQPGDILERTDESSDI